MVIADAGISVTIKNGQTRSTYSHFVLKNRYRNIMAAVVNAGPIPQ